MHIWNAFLSHITPRLIPKRVKMDHKDGKTLPLNTTVFSRLELETTG